MIRRSKRWRGVRDDREQLECVEFQPGNIYKYYYTLEDSDPGIMMETNLATKEVSGIKTNNLFEKFLSRTMFRLVSDFFKNCYYSFFRMNQFLCSAFFI